MNGTRPLLRPQQPNVRLERQIDTLMAEIQSLTTGIADDAIIAYQLNSQRGMATVRILQGNEQTLHTVTLSSAEPATASRRAA